ncbi:hypothetical protein Bca4012_097693 [Brassica carinata]
MEQYVPIQVWGLVPKPENMNVIGTKWISKIKPMRWKLARFESIRLSLKLHVKINLYQMDVKSTFLTRVLQEELYVAQPKNLNIHTILTI